MSSAPISYLDQKTAKAIDDELMGVHRFSLDQLMELAGLSCACAALDCFPEASKPMIICGPGNNGGDGLVAARHLAHFGCSPTVWCPLDFKQQHHQSLVSQCVDVGISVFKTTPKSLKGYDYVVDAVFGFGFKGSVRAPFDTILMQVNDSDLPVFAIDIPSGWDVEKGNISGNGIKNVAALVSLTAPKLCAKSFSGKHYLGGRFVPGKLAEKYKLVLPRYRSSQQFVLLSSV